MLIYNKDTTKGYLNVSQKTTKVYIGLSVTIPHEEFYILEYFFLKDLKNEIIENLSDNNYKPNKDQVINVYHCEEEASITLNYILTLSFQNISEAKKNINKYIRDSNHVSKRTFNEVVFLDGNLIDELFLKITNKIKTSDNKKEKAKNILIQSISSHINQLKNQYKENVLLTKMADTVLENIIEQLSNS